jgi:hypothetical protein
MSSTFDIINGALATSTFTADPNDPSKVISFDSSGATTATSLTLASLQTTSQTLSFPILQRLIL